MLLACALYGAFANSINHLESCAYLTFGYCSCYQVTYITHMLLWSLSNPSSKVICTCRTVIRERVHLSGCLGSPSLDLCVLAW